MSGRRRTPPLPAEENGSGLSRRRTEQREAVDPSSSRPRSAAVIWPEHFVEEVALRLAADAARPGRRLDAAPAIVPLFQVCSAWRCFSRSEVLWQELTRVVWPLRHVLVRRRPSWREEFISLHRTATNFRSGSFMHSQIRDPQIRPAHLVCRRLALSDRHLAAGFSDGSVRLYHLPAVSLLALHGLGNRDRLGQFSSSVSGIILLGRRLVFASQDGDVGVVEDGFAGAAARRARAGHPVEDGVLVDFAGDERWWVGIFAGAPGWSWRVWDGETEREVHAGGSLTDGFSVAGWRMLADISGPSVARVGTGGLGVVVGCTRARAQAVRMEGGRVLEVTAEMELREAAVDGLGASDGRVVVVEVGGRVAVVRDGTTLEEVCRFGVPRGRGRGTGPAIIGCMNSGFVFMWVGGGGGGRVWDSTTGELLYGFMQRVGEVRAVAANDRYVAAWSEDTGLNLWDFGH